MNTKTLTLSAVLIGSLYTSSLNASLTNQQIDDALHLISSRLMPVLDGFVSTQDIDAFLIAQGVIHPSHLSLDLLTQFVRQQPGHAGQTSEALRELHTLIQQDMITLWGHAPAASAAAPAPSAQDHMAVLLAANLSQVRRSDVDPAVVRHFIDTNPNQLDPYAGIKKAYDCAAKHYGILTSRGSPVWTQWDSFRSQVSDLLGLSRVGSSVAASASASPAYATPIPDYPVRIFDIQEARTALAGGMPVVSKNYAFSLAELNQYNIEGIVLPYFGNWDGYRTTSRDGNHVLSNYFEHPTHPLIIQYNGATFQFSSVETAFQAFKFVVTGQSINPEQISALQHMRPDEAKSWARGRYQFAPGNAPIVFNLMYDLVAQKFAGNQELLQQLLLTGNQILVEGNKWNDFVWGAPFNGHTFGLGPKGETPLNQLGQILMAIRHDAANGIAPEKAILSFQ